MAVTLNKTGLRFDEARFFRVVVPGQQDQLWFAAGYVVETAEGEVIHRSHEQELTGAARNRILSVLADINNALRAEEGLP